jgi:hypothetical protein
MPIELGFILQRLAVMAEEDESLQEKQPWKAAYEKDYEWLGGVLDKHYAGDDSDVKVLLGGILQAFAGRTVDEYLAAATSFLDAAPHPTLGRKLRDCWYVPMVELLRYLEANGFTCFIASGGSRDFMRAVTNEIYAIPPERVVGSSNVCSTPTTRRVARSRTSPSRTSSTTVRRSRSGSGAASGGGRCSRAATRTATCACSRGPRGFDCSSSTTTRSGSSTM